MMRRRLERVAPLLLGAMLLGSLTASGAAAHGSSGSRWDLLRAAVATARYHSTNQATRAGYGPFPAGVPLHECISSFDNTGAMGFHWLNGANLTTDLNPTKPQVLVYEPDRNGKLHLVALEFVVFKADWVAAHGDTVPELFGEMFMDSGFPNRFDLPQFYALHVWLWKFNPSGLFAPFNPRVSCDGATGSVGASTVAARGVVADRAMTAGARAGFVCSMRRAASA
jgi:hypothetical protein